MASQRPSVQKREREIKKRERRLQKEAKAAARKAAVENGEAQQYPGDVPPTG